MVQCIKVRLTLHLEKLMAGELKFGQTDRCTKVDLKLGRSVVTAAV